MHLSPLFSFYQGNQHNCKHTYILTNLGSRRQFWTNFEMAKCFYLGRNFFVLKSNAVQRKVEVYIAKHFYRTVFTTKAVASTEFQPITRTGGFPVQGGNFWVTNIKSFVDTSAEYWNQYISNATQICIKIKLKFGLN